MKVWTAHEKPNFPPLLVREGFSFGALLFGPIWLAAQRAWLEAGAVVVLTLLILILTRPPAAIVLILGLALWLGCSGRDLVRWSLTRRGYLATTIVAGRDQYAALAHLFEARPDLVDQSMVAETAP